LNEEARVEEYYGGVAKEKKKKARGREREGEREQTDK
jgi:hypothetical protein